MVLAKAETHMEVQGQRGLEVMPQPTAQLAFSVATRADLTLDI